MQLFKIIEVKTEADLPRQSGEYLCRYKDDSFKETIFVHQNNDWFWLKFVHSYYSPVEVDDWVSVDESRYTPHFIAWRNKYFERKVKVLEYRAGMNHYSLSELHKNYEKSMLQSPFLPAPPSSPNKQ